MSFVDRHPSVFRELTHEQADKLLQLAHDAALGIYDFSHPLYLEWSVGYSKIRGFVHPEQWEIFCMHAALSAALYFRENQQ